MGLKVAYVGAAWEGGVDEENDLLLLILKKVSCEQVKLVSSPKEADFLIAYPYVVGSLAFKLKWAIGIVMRRLGVFKDRTRLLRWLMGTGRKPVLFVSPENLDRPFWWSMLGKFLIDSDVPRLTFWPSEIDPVGVRFPYWYNYVDWPQYPRKQFYKRFGRLYSLEELMSPLPHPTARKDRAVSISSHLDHPRKALLSNLQELMMVDSFGAAGTRFSGGKLDLMCEYKYAFCAENSTGYGYDTEKIPEAWVAGCAPVGFYLNPFSDFNPEIAKCAHGNSEAAYHAPLLLKQPELSSIEDYVRKFLRESFADHAHLQGRDSLSGCA